MNWQKFIGMTITLLSMHFIAKLVGHDWKILSLALLVGVGGLIYGDA